jgi:hypothetical protein
VVVDDENRQPIEELLNSIPGAFERTDEGLAQARRGEGVPLQALATELPCEPPLAPSAVVAVTKLALRLGRVMRPDSVTTWLYTSGIEALGGERPIDLIARGDIRTIARIVSELEDPGAT